ncbi:hypothetical protein [Actinacidiphila bryophytorum]|uniref:hypothetical protein n=1 Tax=Actinacidiphila bryophytorum TaxID=1436133 RepID=UPI002176D0EA|nr:hypothetical protein [Actinacidiphila bryophytorum]UWE08345.1 hypothetical protein NYE86_06140 [Actinacidiphila bryophytorum]
MHQARKTTKRWLLAGGAVAAAAAFTVAALPSANASAPADRGHRAQPVTVQVLSPERRDNTGAEGKGWFVDLELVFHDKATHKTGFTAPQLTGPAAHASTAPFPGLFSPGQDEAVPGLVVLDSTVNSQTPFSGPGTNLANLFNLTGVTDRTSHETRISDTWIVGNPIAGTDKDTVLTVAVVDDLNHDGVYNDAPNVVPDANHDGVVNAADLQRLGIASNVVQVPFHINGAAVA